MCAAVRRQLFAFAYLGRQTERPFRTTAVCGAKVWVAQPAAVGAVQLLGHRPRTRAWLLYKKVPADFFLTRRAKYNIAHNSVPLVPAGYRCYVPQPATLPDGRGWRRAVFQILARGAG